MPSYERNKGGGVDTDRRTVLKATGMAAGAVALGLQPRPIQADPGSDHYVLISDTHLGSPYSNWDATRSFLQNEVFELDPDVLVLNGDFFEFWYRGMSSVILQFNQVSKYVEDIYDAGIDVAMVAGNHDKRLRTVGDTRAELTPDLPWDIGDAYFFESGDTEFVAVHGDGGDPMHVDSVSDWLCTGSDSFGERLLDVREWFNDIDVGEYVGETGTVSVSASGSDWQEVPLEREYDDPVVVTSPASGNGSASVKPRVKNESDGWWWWGGMDSFEIRLENWDGQTGHPAETVHYGVFERGQHKLANTIPINVGRTEVDGTWRTVWFDTTFASTPLVLSNVQTADSGGWFSSSSDPIQSQIRNVTPSHFDVRLREIDGAVPSAHEVGYVAIEPGQVNLQDGGIDVTREISTAGEWKSIEFDHDFHHTPTLLAGVQTTRDGGPRFLRYANLESSSVDVSIQGESNTSPEQSEATGYIALTGFEDVYATETSLVDDDDLETKLEEEWQKTLQATDGISTADAPESPPLAPSAEPQFFDHDYVKDNLLSSFDEFVISGHTHVPDLDERYANTGAWTERNNPDHLPQNCFVEIIDGDVSVWSWSPRGNKLIYSQD